MPMQYDPEAISCDESKADTMSPCHEPLSVTSPDTGNQSENQTLSAAGTDDDDDDDNNDNNGIDGKTTTDNDTVSPTTRRPPPTTGQPTHTNKRRRLSAMAKKRVSWDRIHTREYALVVGDHPLCQDGLPVSLDWQYSSESCSDILAQALSVSERKESYVFPKRMTYEERRERLVSVSGLTAEQVKNDEIDLVVRTLKESWDDVAMEVVEIDPLADVMVWDEVQGIDLDVDFGDITDFEWTD